jgi:predicted lysophospholipase L1 biosynthesis ABC-type transport system permease subunit
MSSIYDDEEAEGEDGTGQSEASRRLADATQRANQALEDALRATLGVSRYLPWLLIGAAGAAVIAAAAVAYAVVAYLQQAPQALP